MNREQMIEALIHNDLHDGNRDEYIWMFLLNGFVGYKNQTDYELKQEMIDRGLIGENSND
jgi:hypothetical protein